MQNGKQGNGTKGDQPTQCWELGSPRQVFIVEWRHLIAEFLGTLFYVFVGTGAAVATVQMSGLTSAAVVGIALAFGLAATAVVYATAPMSGGHLNPVVTVAALITMKISLFKGAMYVLMQVLGGTVGAAFLVAALPYSASSNLDYGATGLARNVPLGVPPYGEYTVTLTNGLLIEIILAFAFVLTVFATSKTLNGESGRNHLGNNAPFAYGAAILVGHILGSPFSGPSMNPARSFASAVVSGYWEDHWLYWVGPIIGGSLGGLVYKHILTSPGNGPKDKLHCDDNREEDGEKETLSSAQHS